MGIIYMQRPFFLGMAIGFGGGGRGGVVDWSVLTKWFPRRQERQNAQLTHEQSCLTGSNAANNAIQSKKRVVTSLQSLIEEPQCF